MYIDMDKEGVRSYVMGNCAEIDAYMITGQIFWGLLCEFSSRISREVCLCTPFLLLGCVILLVVGCSFEASKKRSAKYRCCVVICRRRNSVRRQRQSFVWKWTPFIFQYLILSQHGGVFAGQTGSREGHSFESIGKDEGNEVAISSFPSLSDDETGASRFHVFELWMHKRDRENEYATYKQLMQVDLEKPLGRQILEGWRKGEDLRHYEIVKIGDGIRDPDHAAFRGTKYLAYPREDCGRVPIMVAIDSPRILKTGTIWAKTRNGRIPLQEIFDIIDPGHQCSTEEKCRLTGGMDVEWPGEMPVQPGDFLKAECVEEMSDATCSTFDGSGDEDLEEREGSNHTPSMYGQSRSFGGMDYRDGDEAALMQEQIESDGRFKRNEDPWKGVLTWSLLNAGLPERHGQDDVLTRSHLLDPNGKKSYSWNDKTSTWTSWSWKTAEADRQDLAGGRYPDELRGETELGGKIQETRNLENLRRRALREEAEWHTNVQGQEDITEEALGLATQREDRHIKVHLHGIGERELRVERFWLDTNAISDFLDFLVEMRRRLEDVRTTPDSTLFYVTTQPSPVVYGGEDAITLILDLRPELRTVPILLITRVDEREQDDTYEATAYRSYEQISCSEIKKLTGLWMVCEHNARCTCTHNHNRIADDQYVPVQGGQMMMLHIYFDQLRCDQDTMELGWMTDQEGSQESEGDEVTGMQRRWQTIPAQPFEMPWLYGYCYGRSEPIRAWRYGSNGIPDIPYMAMLCAGQDGTVLRHQVLGFKVRPQPPDIVRLSAEALVLTPQRNLMPWQRLVLVDVNWEYQGPHEQGTNLWRNENSREAKIVEHYLRRATFLQQIGMSPICDQPLWLCTMAHRGTPWNDDNSQRQIDDGDFVEITVRRRPLATPPELIYIPAQEDCDRATSPERTRDQESRPSIETERTDSRSSTGNGTGTMSGDNEDEATVMMHLPLDTSGHEGERHRIQIYPHRMPEPIKMMGNHRNHALIKDKVKEQMMQFGIVKEDDEVILTVVKPQPQDLRQQDVLGFIAAPIKEVHVWQMIILLDVRIDAGTSRGSTQSQQNFWRTVKVVEYHTEQTSFYEQTGLGPLCNRENEPCRVEVRGQVWERNELARFHGGDLVQVTITEVHDGLPISLQLSLARSGCRFEDMAEGLKTRNPSSQGSERQEHEGRDQDGRTTQRKDKEEKRAENAEVGLHGDEDLHWLMQIGRMERSFFLYRRNDNEPYAVTLIDQELREPVRAIREIYWGGRRDVSMEDVHICYLNPQPPDLVRTQTTGMVVFMENELAFNTVLVMLDVEVYGATAMSTDGIPRASDEWREVTAVQGTCSRGSFLQQVGLEAFCLNRGDVCLLSHRGQLWNTQDPNPREFKDGDYLVVKIQNRDEGIPFSQRWRQVHGDCVRPEQDAGREEEHAEPEEEEDDDTTTNTTLQSLDESQEEGEGQHRGEHHTDDNVSLLQKWRPSFTKQAHNRLRPPGNGRKGVRFNEVVTFEKEEEEKIDLGIGNCFIREFCESRQSDEQNPFVRAMMKDMKYEDKKTNEYESQEKEGKAIRLNESLGDTYLPIRSEKKMEEGGISFDKVEQLHAWLDTHVTLPEYEVEKVEWKEASNSWVKSPVMTGKPAEEYHFYTDGSKQGKHSASAVILFCLRDGRWHFGGYVNNQNKGKPSSFSSEVKAQCIALKWIWDICKTEGIYGKTARFYIHYDAIAAGKVVLGKQNCQGNDELCYVARGLSYYVRERFKVEIEGRYVPGHRNDPGNEAADCLANRTAVESTKASTFWNAIFEVKQYRLFAWLWYLVRPDLREYWKGSCLMIPAPTTKYDDQVAKSLQPEVYEGQGDPLKFKLNMVTMNVLSMGTREEKCTGDIGPTKLDALCYQMHEMGVHIFALQETRIKHKLPKHELYTFLQVDADKKGNGGLLLAVSLQHSYAEDETGRNLWFSDLEVKYLVREKSYMMAKINTHFGPFVFALAHAPHSGRPPDCIDQWWKDFSKEVMKHTGNGSLFLLGDFNSRLGEMPTDEVGTHGAEEENQNGAAFKQLLSEMSCYVPATFEESHEGPTATWKHPGGSESRLDYVAIPAEWRNHSITSKVVHGLAVSNCLHDHSAALLQCAGVMPGTKKEVNRKGKRTLCPDVVSTCEYKEKQLEAMGTEVNPTDWGQDVHRHTECLYTSLQEASRKYLPQQTWIRKS